MWYGLSEEIFFFLYHLQLKPKETMQLDPLTRRWLIDRFIKQKEKENEAMEAAKKKSKSGR